MEIMISYITVWGWI